MNKIASIIVTYNGEVWIKKCLDSLLASNIRTDIFVIDNGSKDQTIQIINNYTDVHLYKNGENSGFGKANNIVLKQLFKENKYDYFFLLNQDAWIKPNCLELLVNCFKENQNFGILSPLHYNKDFTDIDYNFKEYISEKQTNAIAPSLVEAPFINAAAWLISKECLHKVGIFNPYFKHYGEDKNYCDRVKYKSLKIGVLTNAEMNHDRKRNIDFIKINYLSKIKLTCIIVNPNIKLWKGYGLAFINIWGIPKYFFKTLPVFQIITLFFNLTLHYIKLLFSLSIRINRKQQKADYFSIQ